MKSTTYLTSILSSEWCWRREWKPLVMGWKSDHNFQQAQTIVQSGFERKPKENVIVVCFVKWIECIFFLSVSQDSEAGVYALSYEITGSGLFSCEDDRTIKMWKQDDRATPETHPSKVKPPKDKWIFWGYQLFIVSFPSNLQRFAENKHNCTHLASTHIHAKKKNKSIFCLKQIQNFSPNSSSIFGKPLKAPTKMTVLKNQQSTKK